MKKIDVLLATYNGACFVSEQIKSVLTNFDKLNDFECRLLISDDASTDDTVKIIENIQSTDSRVFLIDSQRKGGVKLNFSHLIQECGADYVFFCDQDDLWLPDKMQVFMARFHDEERYNEGPVLLHSDLCIVDEKLVPLNISMFECQKLNKSPSFMRLLISNSITGCAMACNKKLLDIIKRGKINNSIMHDWYIALCAAAFGVIIFIDKPYILYRQHGGNQVGAKPLSLKKIFNISKVKYQIADAHSSVLKTRRQAEAFLSDFECNLNDSELHQIKNYIDSFLYGRFKRLGMYLFHDVRKTSILRNIVFFFIYIVMKC